LVSLIPIFRIDVPCLPLESDCVRLMLQFCRPTVLLDSGRILSVFACGCAVRPANTSTIILRDGIVRYAGDSSRACFFLFFFTNFSN